MPKLDYGKNMAFSAGENTIIDDGLSSGETPNYYLAFGLLKEVIEKGMIFRSHDGHWYCGLRDGYAPLTGSVEIELDGFAEEHIEDDE